MPSVFGSLAKIPELRKRILFTIFMLAVYRIGVFVTCPGVDRGVVQKLFGEHQSVASDRRVVRIIRGHLLGIVLHPAVDDIHSDLIGVQADASLDSSGVRGIKVRVPHDIRDDFRHSQLPLIQEP